MLEYNAYFLLENRIWAASSIGNVAEMQKIDVWNARCKLKITIFAKNNIPFNDYDNKYRQSYIRLRFQISDGRRARGKDNSFGSSQKRSEERESASARI